MTLREKLDQLTLLSDGQMKEHPEEARKPVGGVFSETDPALINKYQHDAVENSRLHIPILFAFDTIHGFRTIFPIPLGTASSFDPNVAQTDHRIGAFESAAVGLKQIYSPMVDLSHEPRWGRISEASGEDPYLNSVMAAARVHGAQGNDYSAPDKVVTSVKHYVAYGQPEAGRDYNTTDMSHSRLWNFYLPPFKAAVDAGADTAMCAFNALNGVPACANQYTETHILKQRWGFDGFIESDYTAVAELRQCPGVNPAGGPCGHGVAEDGADAARQALNAGTDSEMVSTNYRDFGPQLVRSGQRVDAPHQRRGAPDPAREVPRGAVRAPVRRRVARRRASSCCRENRAAARTGAQRSLVLLKNDGPTLPLDPTKSTALIGPLGDDRHDMLGPWWGRGDDKDAVSLFEGMQKHGARDLHAGLHAVATTTSTTRRTSAAREDGLRGRGGGLTGGRPDRARRRRDARDERRGGGPLDARPARQAGGADQGGAGRQPRQAARGRALQRAPAGAEGRAAPTRRRSSRRGSAASRPATPSPTCSTARSTRAASCR